MGKRTFRAAFGQAVRKRRNILDISQDEFAHNCGLHRTYIGSIERGERNISIDNMTVIANALEVSLSQLVNEAELLARAIPGEEDGQSVER